ncbi:hypothetical protein L3X38_005491 [Prunus dulcis]|uniref:Uncharacterized protein n=1 Tax=Prunus dulcis TaxID=3755 RepID=A0AAD4ZQW5_PRUDU|nr:hypothetical protein L3X38_005491 [Prunus dulcis]
MKEGEPSLAAIQLKRALKELRETKKMETKALEKFKGNYMSHPEGPKGIKRKDRTKLSDESFTRSIHSDDQHYDYEDNHDQRRELKKSKES